MTTGLKRLPIPLERVQLTLASPIALTSFSGPFTSNQSVTLQPNEALITVYNRSLYYEVGIYHNRSVAAAVISISVITANPMRYYKTAALAGVNTDLIMITSVPYGSINIRAICLEANDASGTMNSLYLRMRLYPAMFSFPAGFFS